MTAPRRIAQGWLRVSDPDTKSALKELSDLLSLVTGATPTIVTPPLAAHSHSEYISREGDTMNAALTLAGDPTSALHAVPMQYVDALDYSDVGAAASVHAHAIADVTDLETALTGKVSTSLLGVASGVATLDADGLLHVSQLPAVAITDTYPVASEAAMLALAAQTGDVAVRTDLNKSFILMGSDPATLGDWQELLSPTDAVQSVNGYAGTVTLYTDDVDEGVGATNLWFTDARAQAAITKAHIESVLTGDISSHSHSAYAAASHAHAQSDITGLATTLAGKSDTGHNHDATYLSLAGGTVSASGSIPLVIERTGAASLGGAGLGFKKTNSAGTAKNYGEIYFTPTDNAAGSEDADFIVFGLRAGTLTENMRVTSTGVVTATSFNGITGLGTTETTAAAGNHTHSYLPLAGGNLTGALTFGTDTNLYRSAANTLKTDTDFVARSVGTVASSTSSAAHSAMVSGDTINRWMLYGGGKMEWGAGGSTARDTSLERTAANTLTMSGSFKATTFYENGSTLASTYAAIGHNHDATYQPLGSYAAASHTHAQADVTGLDTALAGKSDTGHTHSYLPLAGGTLTGNVVLDAAAATSGTQTVDAPTLTLRGSYWTGTATADWDARWTHDITGASTGNLILALGGVSRQFTDQAGNFTLIGDAATSGATTKDSPSIYLRGAYWTTANNNLEGRIFLDVTAATPTSSMVFQIGGSTKASISSAGDVSATTFTEGGSLLSNKYALSGHTHSYLASSGGTLTGDLTLSSAGSVVLTLEADTDNVDETHVPTLLFKMDGGGIIGRIKLSDTFPGGGTAGNHFQIYFEDGDLSATNFLTLGTEGKGDALTIRSSDGGLSLNGQILTNLVFDNSASKNFFVASTAAGTVGRNLTIAAGDTAADATARNIAGGALVLESGQSVGTGTSSIQFYTPTPAGAAGTTLNALALRVTIDSTGLDIESGGLLVGGTSVISSARVASFPTINLDSVNLENRLNATTGAFILGNNDWTGLIYNASNTGTYAYNATNRGITFTGPKDSVLIRMRMPVDPDSQYYCRVKVTRQSGTVGRLYVGAKSMDNSYANVATDTATSYNYFVAANLTVTGTQYYEGTISGYNLTTEGTATKFDPEAKYFDLALFVNNGGTASDVVTIERIEVWRVPNLLMTDTPTTNSAGLRLPHGTAPSSPVNGDIWTTTSGLYARINGTTVGPFGTSSTTGTLTESGSAAMTGGWGFTDASRYWLYTATNWGIYWNTADNQIEFHGGGSSVAEIDLDNGAFTAVSVNATNSSIQALTVTSSANYQSNIAASAGIPAVLSGTHSLTGQTWSGTAVTTHEFKTQTVTSSTGSPSWTATAYHVWKYNNTEIARLTSAGALTATSFNSITGLASAAPNNIGTAAVGTSTLAARADHVHAITKAAVEAVLTGAITSHTHSYLPLAGGTLTGSLSVGANNLSSGYVGINPVNDTGYALRSIISGESTHRFAAHANGTLYWGNGTSEDTNLYRSAANTLKTDDDFQANTLTASTQPNVRVVKTTAQSFNSTTSKVQFATTTSPNGWDAGSDWNAVDYSFTAPESGYYFANALLELQPATGRAQLELRINGAQHVAVDDKTLPGDYTKVGGCAVVYLTAGQALSVWLYTANATNLYTGGGTVFNYFTVYKLP